MKSKLLSVATCTTFILACSPSDSGSTPTDGASMAGAAGPQVVIVMPPKAPTVWSIGSEPAVSIGSIDGPAGELFTYVHDASFAANGDILVVDSGSREIRRFDASGRFLATVGGEGDGPGEFPIAPFAVGLESGGTLAWDPQRYRFVEFGPDGNLVREVRARDLVSGHGLAPLPSSQVWQISSDGRALWTGPDGESLRSTGPERHYPFVLLDAFDSTSVGLGRFHVSTRVSLGDRGFTYPFSPSASAVLGPDSMPVVVADPSEWRLSEVGPTGDVERIFALAVPRLPTSDAIVRSEIDSLPRRVKVLNKPSLGEVRDAFDAVPLPDSLPAISLLMRDPSGNLWVGERTGRSTATGGFHVISPHGEYIARARLDANVTRILDVSDDQVLAVHTDALGVQSIWLIPIVRPQ